MGQPCGPRARALAKLYRTRRSGLTVSSTTHPVSVPRTARSTRGPMAILTVLFFSCGFLAALNDILIPHLKPIFQLNYAQVMLIQFSFFSAFLVFAFPSSKLIEHLGYQKTMAV